MFFVCLFQFWFCIKKGDLVSISSPDLIILHLQYIILKEATLSEGNRNSFSWHLLLFFKDTREEAETEREIEVCERWDLKEGDKSWCRGPAEAVYAEKSYWVRFSVESEYKKGNNEVLNIFTLISSWRPRKGGDQIHENNLGAASRWRKLYKPV